MMNIALSVIFLSIGLIESHSLDEETLIKDFISKYDANKDDILNKSELLQAIKNKHYEDVKEEAKSRIKDGDKNADGLLSWEEYVSQLPNHNELDKNEYERMKTEEKEVFEFSDKNQDHMLDAEELAHIIDPVVSDASFLKHTEMVMKTVDANHDGKLDFDEFYQLYAMEHGGSVEDSNTSFHFFDENKDGALEREELSKLLLSDHKKEEDDELKSYLLTTDTNQDSSLSQQEISDHFHSLYNLMDDHNEYEADETEGIDVLEHSHHQEHEHEDQLDHDEL